MALAIKPLDPTLQEMLEDYKGIILTEDILCLPGFLQGEQVCELIVLLHKVKVRHHRRVVLEKQNGRYTPNRLLPNRGKYPAQISLIHKTANSLYKKKMD